VTSNQHEQLPLFDFADESMFEDMVTTTHAIGFSDYVVYVDESGDHSLASINPDYPVFVLAFCIFHKRHYAERVIPSIEKFKFNYFGHDAIVLHEHEIRKQTGDFTLLTQRNLRASFMDDLSRLMDVNNYVVVACVIDKHRLKEAKSPLEEGSNPYHIALDFCLDGLYDFLNEKNQLNRRTHVLVECRGKKEDKELELEFRRLCDGNQRKGVPLPFDVVFLDKKTNAVGLQLADLVARQIGIHYLRPEQPNRAFEIIEQKILCRGGRQQLGEDYEGHGLKIVPLPVKPAPIKAKGLREPPEAITPIGNPQST
jgi:hypothetical protein